MMKSSLGSKGISLVETIIYATVLTLLLFVVAMISISLVKSHRRVSLNRELESNAAFAMERMVREVRLADSVNDGLSVFNSSPGTLTLQGVDGGTAYTVKFDVDNGQVRLTKDAGTPGFLTSDQVVVTDLIFQKASNVNSEVVKIILELEGSRGDDTKRIKVNGFAVLRGSY